jgi:ectoine hydroxylase-related dioxygenase (phytanoyl-CoA dioxygenase family)
MSVQPIVDKQAIERFQIDGAVALRGLLDLTWIEALRGAAEELLDGSYDPSARMGTGESPILQSSGKWQESATFRRFLVDSPIAAASAALMQSGSARLFEDLFQVRPPGLGNPSWHRDMPYWPVSGRQATNVWFVLEPVTPYKGSIHVVAGSHLHPRESVRLITEPGASHEVLAFGCEPGDVIIFHPWALHTGYGSWPDQARRTFTIRFLGDDIRWRPTREYYYEWMRDTGLTQGDSLDHPGFPVMWTADAAIGLTPHLARHS